MDDFQELGIGRPLEGLPDEARHHDLRGVRSLNLGAMVAMQNELRNRSAKVAPQEFEPLGIRLAGRTIQDERFNAQAAAAAFCNTVVRIDNRFRPAMPMSPVDLPPVCQGFPEPVRKLGRLVSRCINSACVIRWLLAWGFVVPAKPAVDDKLEGVDERADPVTDGTQV